MISQLWVFLPVIFDDGADDGRYGRCGSVGDDEEPPSL